MIADGAIRKLEAHQWARETDDHYVEPDWCSRRLFAEEGFTGSVWDPACGFGRIVEAANDAGLTAHGSDLVDRGYKGDFQRMDFFTCDWMVENIVTNPPFDIASKFALHALAGTTSKVAIIFPTARLNAAHWIQGTPLSRLWLLTPRPSMPPGHVIARGEKPGGGKMDYCWLVWKQGHVGPPELRWLRRDAHT